MIHIKELLKIFTIFSLVFTTAIATDYFISVDSQWHSSSVFYHDHGYALVGHMIKSLSLFMADCMQACQVTLECFSLNYRSFFNGTFRCELNRSSRKQNPGSYVRKEGYQYSEPPSQEMKYCTQQECTAKEALPAGWYRFNSSLFKLLTENKNWTNARQHCQSLGGDLVSFSTETENTFVSKTLLWDSSSTAPSPLARYKMDGTDPNLSLTGGAAVSNVDSTKAVYFDGVDDQATIPPFDIRTTDFTVAIWIKPIAPWGWVNTVFEDYNAGITQFLMYFYEGGLDIRFYSADGEIRQVLSGIPLGQWTHLTVTWSRDQKTAKLFVDAIQRVHTTVSYQNIDLIDNPNPVWRLGARVGAHNKYFKGWMRDLIVVPNALSPEEIQQLKDDQVPNNAWIGLNDVASEGLFQWSDGSPLTFTSTGYTADNTVAKNCVMMGSAKEWLVKDCIKKASFICEKKAE